MSFGADRGWDVAMYRQRFGEMTWTLRGDVILPDLKAILEILNMLFGTGAKSSSPLLPSRYGATGSSSSRGGHLKPSVPS